MNSTTATEPLDGEDLINYSDVTARIAYLESRDCHQPDREEYPCAGWYDCPTCDEASERELTSLRDLEEAMRPANEASDRATAIRDDYLETFVRNEADDLVGDGLNFLESYVKWDELTADRAAEMKEITFGSTTYYITT